MCGRYTLYHTSESIVERFAIDSLDAVISPRYNIAPMQKVAAICQSEDGSRTLSEMQWGLVPFWSKQKPVKARLINASSEALADQPAFCNALRRRRCLVPADGFYKWQIDGYTRTPMYLQAGETSLFGFAGLWEEWLSPEGITLQSCVIITVPANTAVSLIHSRMPAILDPHAESLWLNNALLPKEVTSFLTPYSDDLHCYPVSPRVAMELFDSPACILPIITTL